MINNPATANLPTDTNLLARITFEEEEFNFDTVTEGDIVIHEFKFTNYCKVPLTILKARSSVDAPFQNGRKNPCRLVE
jgi:hypothetical protein